MYYRRLIRNAIRRNRQEVAVQFRDCILSVTASLQAGYSVENAMLESIHDMEIIHGRDSVIYRELILIRRGMRINISLEELLTEFGRRSECEEIIQFAEVFSIAKRSSGSLTNIIKNSAELISKKISIRQEITVLVSGKQMELTIMKGMPFVILLYVESANRGYFDCLYHNAGGIAVMTGCLIAYLVAYGCGERIMSNTMRYLA